MKTKEELEQIKEEYTELNKKLAELTEDELNQVSGGARQINPNIWGAIATGVTPGVLVDALDSQSFTINPQSNPEAIQPMGEY